MAMGQEKRLTQDQIERMKKIMRGYTDPYQALSGNMGTSGRMGVPGNMGNPLRNVKKELLDSLDKDYPGMFDINIKNKPVDYMVSSGSTYPHGSKDAEEYYQKWCGHTKNETQTINVDNSRDTVNHNIQELTPRAEKVKPKWKFWGK